MYQQVEPDDELLIITDTADDPAASAVADRDRAVLVTAGEPEGCSGKCNAIAAGLERATHDTIILTDDDVPRDAQWLTRLKKGVHQHGAVFGAPLFVHTDGTGRLLGCPYEPAQAFGSLLLLLSEGVWGGGAGFHRRHIDDMDATIRDLRRTAADDLLIGTHLTIEPAGDIDLATTISASPSLDGVFDRVVRHILTFRYFQEGSQWVNLLMGVVQLVALVVAPLLTVGVSILSAVVIYRQFDLVRWTVVFAPISLILNAVLTVYALGRPEFEWGGRRYRWTGTFDVEWLREE